MVSLLHLCDRLPSEAMEPVSNVNRQGYLFDQLELRPQISNTLIQLIKGRKASISGEGMFLKEKNKSKRLHALAFQNWNREYGLR